MRSANSAFRPPSPASAPPPAERAGVSPERLQAASRGIKAGIWACAAVTMTASVVNGTSVFASLTSSPIGILVGFLTALAVDAALIVVLTGDSKMQDLEVSSSWGRAMRWVLLLMSLALNCGASLLGHHWFLAALHAVPPVLLCGLSEYGQDVGHTFARKVREQREQEVARRHTEAERAEAGRLSDQARTDELAKSENARRAAEEYARIRPAELEAEKQARDAEQHDKDREAAEREQIREHAISLTTYLFLARRLQAAALAARHAGMALLQDRANTPRNGSPDSLTKPSPAGPPAASPDAHRADPPAPPGGSPGDRQVSPPDPRRSPTPDTTRATRQVRPDIPWLADLAEPWLDANPDAGRTRLVKQLAKLVNEAGDEVGEHLVTRPGEAPGDRITDHVGKQVLQEVKRRRDRREIVELERLLTE